MFTFDKLSIRVKTTTLMLILTLIVLSISTFIYVFLEISSIRTDIAQNYTRQAKLVGSYSIGSLDFMDKNRAKRISFV